MQPGAFTADPAIWGRPTATRQVVGSAPTATTTAGWGFSNRNMNLEQGLPWDLRTLTDLQTAAGTLTSTTSDRVTKTGAEAHDGKGTLLQETHEALTSGSQAVAQQLWAQLLACLMADPARGTAGSLHGTFCPSAGCTLPGDSVCDHDVMPAALQSHTGLLPAGLLIGLPAALS